MKRLLIALLLLSMFSGVASAAVVQGAQSRRWTSRDGKFSFNGTLLEDRPNHVVLRGANGKRIDVSKEKLSAVDLLYLQEKVGAQTEPPVVEPTRPAPQSPVAAPGDARPSFGDARKSRATMGVEVIASNGACRNLVATFPLPIDWPEQTVQVVGKDMSRHITTVRERVLDNGVKQMEVHIPRLARGQTARAVIELEIAISGIGQPKDPDSLVIPTRLPRNVRQYLSASPMIESDHAEIKKVAENFKIDPTKPAWPQVEKMYSWVRDHISRYEGTIKLHGALTALRTKKGDCEEYTSLFVALCRANGIPARSVWVPGHAYPEFYLQDADGNGYWFPCESLGDYSFGSISAYDVVMQKGDSFKMSQKRERQRYVTETLTGVPAEAGAGSPVIRPVRILNGQPSPFVGS